MSVYALTSPETLHGFGIAPSMEAVELGVSACAGTARRTVRPLPLERSERSLEAWWDLTPLTQPLQGPWLQALDGSRESLPLYLRNPDRNYWFEYLPDSGILYFHYNRSQDMAEESTAAFGERLLAELDRRRPRAFVLDVRFNTGGNLHIAEALMRRLQERTRGMKRYAITGRTTFSAGISQVASWRQAGDVTIVGEPVGDHLDMWAEGGNIRLPNSGLLAHFANGAHSYSPAPCPSAEPCADMSVATLVPDIFATPDWQAYRSGRDPALEAVAADLGGSRRR
jgi:hypothetical protein